MSDFQTAYLLALLILTPMAWRRQGYALGWLWFNMLAMLAAAGAMDMGWIERTGATLTMMLIDFGTGVGLAMRPGLPRLLAWLYAITIPVYAANVVFGLSLSDTWAIVYIVAVVQLGMLGIGSYGSGGGNGRRRSSGRPVASVTARNAKISSAAVLGYTARDGDQA
ncbi:MAG: hypothetical protein ACRC6I_18230 [Paracoccaceae bacterium]